MRILIFTDLHLHLWRKFGLDLRTGLPRRLVEQLAVMDKVGNIILEKKVDMAAFVGDLLHKVGEVPVEVTNFAHDKIKKWGIPVYFVPGNHDIVNREDPKWYESSVHFFQQNYWFQTPGPAILVKNSVKILGIGFGDYAKYEKDGEEIKGYDLVFIHDTPAGAMIGGYKMDTGVDWKKLAKNNKWVFFGHVHYGQKLSYNCIVVGSLMDLDFGDLGDKGVYIYDSETDKVEFVPVESPRFITVDTADMIKDEKNYYRVLNSEKRIDLPNAVSVVVPKFYDERIKATDLYGIAKEWADLQGAPEGHLAYIKGKLENFDEVRVAVTKGFIKSVEIENFGSVGKAHYRLQRGGGFTLVAGESDVFGSNGAGKTTVTGDAILWCLFGETTKGLTGDDVIRRGQDDAVVTVFIQDSDRAYFITRSRKKGLLVNAISADGKFDFGDMVKGLRHSDRQRVLEQQVLGFDRVLFMASCYFSQEDIITITGLGDTDRNNFITDLLGFSKYDRLYSICDDDMKKLNSFIDLDNNNIQQLNNKIENEKSKISVHEGRVEYCKKEISNTKVKMRNLNDLINGKEFEISAIKSVSVDEEVASTKEQLKKIEESIADAEKQKDLIWKDKEKAEEQYYTANSLKSKVVSEIKGIQRMIDEEEKKANKVMNSETGATCEYCGGIVDPANIGKYVADCRLKIVGYQSELAKLEESRVAHVTEEDRATGEVGSAKSKLKIVEESISSWKKMKTAWSDKAEMLSKKAKESEFKKSELLGDIKSYQRSIKDCEDTLLRLGDDAQDVSQAIEECKGRVRQYELECEKILLSVKEKGVKIEAATFWKNAFSPKGIRSLLIDRFCNQFNRIANTYLSEISSGKMSIEMSPISTLKSGEERNKLGMDISLDGYTVSYKSLSGGEKRRVDVSLCLALNEWVSQKYSIENGLLGVIIFDEIFSFLDKLAEEAIGSLLYREGFKKSVLVISHTADLASYCGYTMQVVRKNGISEIQSYEKDMTQTGENNGNN
jgi:DNA repair exonuclease SbcCD ATPase subunit